MFTLFESPAMLVLQRQDFVSLVLLSSWMDLPEMDNFEVLEFYSGKDRISRFCS